jgi:hypothetical protein
LIATRIVMVYLLMAEKKFQFAAAGFAGLAEV